MRAAALVAGLALLAAPAGAQQTDDLTGLLDSLAELWSAGNAAGIASHGAATGLDLEVHGDALGSLRGRRAAAALRQLFAGQETVTVQRGSAARVVGAEDRAFGELIWEVRMPGAAVTEARKIFVALVREDDAWRVSEIRILR